MENQPPRRGHKSSLKAGKIVHIWRLAGDLEQSTTSAHCMKEKLRPGLAFQQGGNNAHKVGNKGLIVLWPALGDTKKKNIRDGL